MFKRIVLLGILLASLSCTSQKSEKITTLNYTDFKEKVVGKNVQLIDVRTDKEYKNGFIDDAIQMNFSESEKFIKQIETLEKNKPVYIYCHSGGRSGRASKLLLKKGFTKIYDFSGGYKSWTQKSN
ncbi:MAG: rhodanese-like domain-containing protein [Polaribacter sp.]